MIEPIRQTKGVSRAKAICDECGRDEVFSCSYSRNAKTKMQKPNSGQIIDKAVRQQGWSFIKGKLRCPACEANRKVSPVKTAPTPPVETREPTRAQKRKIIDLLDAVYDSDNERYKSGDTDDTVAEVLEVMPGWVAEIREEFYGPDGGNENIEDLAARLGAFEPDIAAILQAAEAVTTNAQRKLAEVSAMKADLERIKKAVGPRNLKKAQVSR